MSTPPGEEPCLQSVLCTSQPFPPSEAWQRGVWPWSSWQKPSKGTGDCVSRPCEPRTSSSGPDDPFLLQHERGSIHQARDHGHAQAQRDGSRAGVRRPPVSSRCRTDHHPHARAVPPAQSPANPRFFFASQKPAWNQQLLCGIRLGPQAPPTAPAPAAAAESSAPSGTETPAVNSALGFMPSSEAGWMETEPCLHRPPFSRVDRGALH
ncbi:UNVERIFIED_CONTAM: hypothetical protein K2H54_042774 [Gekko kuhli]